MSVTLSLSVKWELSEILCVKDLWSSEFSGKLSFSGGANDEDGDGENDHIPFTGQQPCFCHLIPSDSLVTQVFLLSSHVVCPGPCFLPSFKQLSAFSR